MYFEAVNKINAMSIDAFRETLIELGISKPNGKLTAKYASRKKRSAKASGAK